MTVFLEPTSTELGAGWHAFGGAGTIVQELAQGVHHPSTPAAQGAEWTEGVPGGGALVLRLEHSAETGTRTLWMYFSRVPVAVNWQYGWGTIGNHASGLVGAVVGWNALSVSASAVLNELWVEIMPTGPGEADHGLQVEACYCQVGETAPSNALRMLL